MIRLLFPVVMSWCLVGAISNAAPPGKPVEFNAKGKYTDSTGIYKVELQWIAPRWNNATSRPEGFYLYRANGKTEDLSQFQRIATVLFDSSNTHQLYTYTDQPLQEGTYSYYVVAYNSDGESPRTRILFVTLPPETPAEKLLSFTSEPPKKGITGVEYRYQARAVTTIQGATIRYQLVSGPEGMTIDQTTGLLTWTPQQPGRYEVTIQATIEVQGRVISATQQWVIYVSNDEEEHKTCVEIEGIVIDNHHRSMIGGTVIAYRAASQNNATVWIAAARAEVDKQGTFLLRLPAGSYKFFTDGRDYIPQWYENSSNADSARVLTFECHGSVTTTARLVFTVTPRHPEQRYTVSGRVISAETGAGVDAWVKFMAVMDEHNDHGYDWAQYKTFTTETDAEGNYTIQLSNRYTYIARAIPRSEDYLPLYWDAASNIAQASRISLTGNRDNINFALQSRPNAHGGFGGRIIDSAGYGLQGWAIACRILSRNSDRGERIRRYRTVETDSMGYYRITGLEPGIYVVLGISRSKDWVPGYCVLGDYATLRWRTATRIGIDDAMLTVQYDIKLRTRAGERGIIRLEGTVRGRGGQIKHGVSEQGAQAIGGALVAFVTNSGIANYTLSQDDGFFAMPELTPMNGQVVVDHPDYESYSVPLPLTPTLSVVSHDPAMDPAVVSSVDDHELGTIMLAPNPAGSEVQVQLGSINGAVRIELVNLLGTVVASTLTEQPFTHIALDGVASGVYVVRITGGTKVHNLPLVIIR